MAEFCLFGKISIMKLLAQNRLIQYFQEISEHFIKIYYDTDPLRILLATVLETNVRFWLATDSTTHFLNLPDCATGRFTKWAKKIEGHQSFCWPLILLYPCFGLLVTSVLSDATLADLLASSMTVIQFWSTYLHTNDSPILDRACHCLTACNKCNKTDVLSTKLSRLGLLYPIL